ncbi:MAG: phytanoyl-CoA dioxygenase family protein [Candidatus Poribacteria bacterium]
MIDDVFPPADVARLREACESPEVTTEWKKRDHENKTVHLLEITVKHTIFVELAKSPRILNRITPLIGSDVQLQHSKLATKPPTKGKGPFAWHQDFAYFPHTNIDLVAVMVLLDDATPENGCMQIVRGSHKLGLLNHMQGGLFTGTCQESPYWEDEIRLAQVIPKMGGLVSTTAWHFIVRPSISLVDHVAALFFSIVPTMPTNWRTVSGQTLAY